MAASAYGTGPGADASGSTPGESDHDRLEREGNDSIAACRQWKSLWIEDLTEAYFFASPQRQRQLLSDNQPPTQRRLDAPELNTDFAMELCDDFATEIITTYMPEQVPWCERVAGESTSPQAWEQVKEQVRTADERIFAAIKASNFYPEISKAFEPDLAIGTVALWIERPRAAEPIVCTSVPLRELEVALGPYGELDDRWAVRYARNKYVRKLVGEEIWDQVPADEKEKIKEKPLDKTEVRWGFWRRWDDVGDESWQHVVFIGKKLIHSAVIKGAGSCPLIPFRWAPNPDWPWGHGPLLKALPTLRQIDELEMMRLSHADMSARPTITYPDDSFVAVEQGLEPGMAVPIRVGSEGAVKSIYNPPPFDSANYAYEQKELRLRRMFYVDFPQQSGDTPPTLGQWLDEMARAQRRIGRPGLPFWREGPAKIFERYAYLLDKSGAVPMIAIDGHNVALSPRNPTQRAAEQQDIALATNALQIMANFFPEEMKIRIDGAATAKAIIDRMRVAALIKFRDPDQIAGAVSQIQKLVGGNAPGAQGVNPQQ